MNRATIFAGIKAARGKGYSPADVALVDALLDQLGVAREGGARKLANPPAFFTAIRPLFGNSLTTSQVEGVERKLRLMGEAGWSVAFTAYALATVFHETGARMQPVREGFEASDAWRKAHLRYYPWYGRGDVQTTWEDNYRKADAKLDLGGTLIANPDRMLEPEISARTLVRGMAEGWFSGKKLGDYLPAERGTFEQFKAARPIVNVHDKDALIAGYAVKFQDGLIVGGWA